MRVSAPLWRLVVLFILWGGRYIRQTTDGRPYGIAEVMHRLYGYGWTLQKKIFNFQFSICMRSSWTKKDFKSSSISYLK